MALTEQENELYDRQIRLWGSETQMKLRTAMVLLLNFDQVAADLAKNLALSGMKVSVFDPNPVSDRDVSTLFLCTPNDLGLPVPSNQRHTLAVREISAMNALTEVRCANGPLDEEIASSRCVVLSNASVPEAIQVNEKCRAANVPFYYIVSQGRTGGFVADLGETYVYTAKGKPESTVTTTYSPLAVVSKQEDWPFGEHTEGRFEACVSAVVAGEISQDIVKVVAGVGEPVRNCFVYDMEAGNGVVKTLV